MEIGAFVLSCISILLSIIFGIITFVQNRKLHNENKILTCKPNLQVELLWDNKIGGQIIKKEYAIDSFNVWESKYTPFYTDGNIYLNNTFNKQKPVFTLFISNSGFGPAKNIVLTSIKFILDNKVITNIEKKSNICNNISAGQKIAKKIYCDIPKKALNKIQIEIDYFDMNNKHYSKRYVYLDSDLNENLVEIEED